MRFLIFFMFYFPCYGQEDLIVKYASKYDLDVKIVRSLIAVESSGISKAKNPDGSYGLMQLQLGTARVMGFKGKPSELFNPEVNISIGTKYLKYLIDKFDGDAMVALDAYNRGWGNVKKYPYRGEWVNHRYVGLILKQMKKVN